jgi:hypothetical protein
MTCSPKKSATGANLAKALAKLELARGSYDLEVAADLIDEAQVQIMAAIGAIDMHRDASGEKHRHIAADPWPPV